MPPLLQGVGILALPWLAGLAALSLRPIPRCAGLATHLADLSIALDMDRNPWGLLVSRRGPDCRHPVAAKLATSGRVGIGRGPIGTRSGPANREFAGTRGDGRHLATGALVRPVPPGCGLRCDLSDPGPVLHPMDRRTDHRAGILILADGPDDARSQAAVLGLMVLAVNLTALIAARLTSASPGDGELDRL